MAIKQTNNPKVDLVYRKRKSAEEMKHQVITFALMIFLTLVAFVAVAYPKTCFLLTFVACSNRILYGPIIKKYPMRIESINNKKIGLHSA